MKVKVITDAKIKAKTSQNEIMNKYHFTTIYRCKNMTRI